MKHLFRTMVLSAAAWAFVGCEADTGVLAIDATGDIAGFVYVDRNANGLPEQQIDLPAAGVSVALLMPAGQSVIARVTTDATGSYIFRDIPVGRYRIEVEPASLGDTLQLSSIDSASVTVVAHDTTSTIVALGFPQVPVTEVATLPVGRRIIVQGMALNAWAAFGDSTLHVADTSGVLRALRVAPTAVAAGDTVRLLGTVVTHNGVNTIGDVTVFRLGSGSVTRIPQDVSTAVAASANGGTLDNDLVRIRSAVVLNTQVVPGERRIAVDDGSGIVEVVLEGTNVLNALPTPTPGQLMDVTGLLIAVDGRTRWQLKPRVAGDVTFTFQRVTVAQARTTPTGRLVEINGLAMNAWVTFGDSTVHIVDPTGSLRATRVAPSNIFAGDSVRLVGRISMRDGQVILQQVEPTVLLANRTLQPPQLITTQVASTADAGRLDAALVRVQNATIISTATFANGDFVVRVNDGSGLLEILIDSALGLANAQFTIGSRVDAVGLLVPTAGGASWQLKPRAQSDITVTP